MFGIFKRKSKNTAFTFTHHRKLSEIEESWDSLLPANHHLLSKNLHFIEQNTSIQGHYIKVFKNGIFSGNIYLQKVNVPINNIGYSLKNFQRLECIINSIKSVRCGLDFLVCGNIFRPNQEGYFFNNGLTKETVFEEFIIYIENLEKEIGFAGILIKECNSPLLREGKFTPIKQDVSMEMTLNSDWLTIGDYVEDLDKKYRKRFQKIHESGAELDKRELSSDELQHFQKQMFELYNQVYSTQEFKLTDISESYFINLKTVLGEKLKIYGFFKNEELLAFSTHIYNEKRQMEIHYIGLNYEWNKKYNLYFNILQFGLEQAIIDKQESLELGRTAHVAKASLGAKPTPNYNYVYFKKHIYSWSFQLFLRKMYNNIESEWQTRSPFAAGVEV
ncbi:hypothetical protein [Lacihabitans sp. CS3-21]|uniref:hypothetical protein n=1 Tax=Lacihabitans sp. CS3-21 TaxID=2487332 RepID=UPI0020CB8F78|nr:hypothetical protein [Lacihabitans sp. CS3-21]MCP9747794.1 hypothetical protein [Lacihabitans sp. CS3-21]